MIADRRTVLALAAGSVIAPALPSPARPETPAMTPPSDRHREILARIAAYGIDLGRSAPGGAYAATVEDGGLVEVSGMVCSLDGIVVVAGRAGAEVSLAGAQRGAAISALRCLDALAVRLGDLGRLRRILKMTVYVQVAPGFQQISEVSNGASDVLKTVLAPFGDHARTSVGAFALPRNAVVELDMTAAVSPA